METDDIWISIILPLIIGPLFIFFKTVWDRTCELKQKKKQLLFDDTRNRLKHQLDDFYYPVYLKLLLLYSLSFFLPEKEINDETSTDSCESIYKRKSTIHGRKSIYTYDNESISSSDSDLCSSDEETHMPEQNILQKRRTYKKRRCLAYYKNENEYIKCRNVIPQNGFSKICKTCKWKFLSGKIEINIFEENEIRSNSIFYIPNINKQPSSPLQSSSKIEPLQKITKRTNKKKNVNFEKIKDITIQIPDFIDVSELESNEKNKSIMNQMNMLSISISEKTISIIEHACNKYYKDIAECIENTIHIIEPNTRLTKHLILFLKYAKIRDLIHENNLCETDCKPEDFGAKNNINQLLCHIEANLNKYGNQYKNLMENGNI